MKKTAIALGMLIASLALAGGPGVDASIKAVHDQFSSAMTKGDYTTARKIVQANFAADFQNVGKSGRKVSLKEFLANLAPPSSYKITSFKFMVGKATVSGNTATVIATSDVNGTLNDGKTTHKMHGSSTDRETWVKVGNAWKMKSMVTLKETATMDGKPVGG